MCLKKDCIRPFDTTQYAASADFCTVFQEDLSDLYLLSFLLTGDRKTAEQCFVNSLEDCLKTNHVFREWARSWAKRTIIQNAIRLLRPNPASVRVAGERRTIREASLEIENLLVFDDFERFVFVMSVLERYSDRDCALLLNCGDREIRQSRIHAFEQLSRSQRPSGHEVTNILQETR